MPEQAVNNKYIYNLEQTKKTLLTSLETLNKEKILHYGKQLHAVDIAIFINESTAAQREILFSILANHFHPETILNFDSNILTEMLEIIGSKKMAEYIAKLDIDDALSVLEKLDKDIRKDIFFNLSKSLQEKLEEGLSYPEGSAGRIMNRKFFYIPKYATIKEIINYYRSYLKKNSQDITNIIVINFSLNPIGYIPVKDLIKYEDTERAADIMSSNIYTVTSEENETEIANIFSKYDLNHICVVDKNKRIIGVIDINDALDIIEENAEEEALNTAGIKESDIHASIYNTIKNRSKWLLLNLSIASLTSFFISLFQDILEKHIILAVLMSIIASLSSSAGMQTTTVLIRGLINNDIRYLHNLLLKELAVAIINAICLSLLVGYIIYYIEGQYLISIIFSIALLFGMITSSLFGVIIPYTLYKIGIDLAVASVVLLTTVSDIASFVGFLYVAKLLL